MTKTSITSIAFAILILVNCYITPDAKARKEYKHFIQLLLLYDLSFLSIDTKEFQLNFTKQVTSLNLSSLETEEIMFSSYGGFNSFVISFGFNDSVKQGTEYIWISSLISPNGIQLINGSLTPGNYLNQFLKPQIQVGVNTFLVPNTPQYMPEKGIYRIKFATESTNAGLSGFAKIKFRNPFTNKLVIPCNVYLTKGLNIDANNFNSSMQNVLYESRRLFSNLNIEMNILTINVLNDNKYDNLNSLSTETDDAFKMIQNSTNSTPDAINLFIVKTIGSSGSVLGFTPSIPGAIGKNNTIRSGIIVATRLSNENLFDFHSDLIARSIVHETFHFLGLKHTTEKSGLAFDDFGDTPECKKGTYDSNNDGIVSPEECTNTDGKNLMFWSQEYNFSQENLSNMQKDIIYRSPFFN